MLKRMRIVQLHHIGASTIVKCYRITLLLLRVLLLWVPALLWIVPLLWGVASLWGISSLWRVALLLVALRRVATLLGVALLLVALRRISRGCRRIALLITAWLLLTVPLLLLAILSVLMLFAVLLLLSRLFAKTGTHVDAGLKFKRVTRPLGYLHMSDVIERVKVRRIRSVGMSRFTVAVQVLQHTCTPVQRSFTA